MLPFVNLHNLFDRLRPRIWYIDISPLLKAQDVACLGARYLGLMDQAVIASVMAKRVVRGNATDGEMDFVRWYASLDIPQFNEAEVDGALRSLESEVAEHRSN